MIDIPNDGPKEVIETFRQQLQDFEKENAVLREAISDAWQTHTACQKALADAQSEVQELTTQNRMLSQYLMDTGAERLHSYWTYLRRIKESIWRRSHKPCPIASSSTGRPNSFLKGVKRPPAFFCLKFFYFVIITVILNS